MMLHPYQWSLSLTALTSGALGLFMLWQNPKAIINVTWCAMNVAVAMWAIGTCVGGFTFNERTAILWWNIAAYGALLIPICYAHVANALVGRRGSEQWMVMGGYLLALLSVSSLVTLQLPKSVSAKSVFVFYPDADPTYDLFVGIFWIYALYAHAVLVRHFRTQLVAKQKQIALVLVATLLGFVGMTPAFLLVHGKSTALWTMHLLPLYTGIIAYAIVRHQLMDITIVLRKSIVYSALVALITATYLIFVLLSERLLQGALGFYGWTASLPVAFVIALGFIPIRNRIQAFVDRYFFKGTQAMLAAENERMRQELERAERMKRVSILATGLAHEIKNPLSAIRTFVAYLPERYHDAAFREKFTRIVGNEVERINTIVQQLLHFAKPALLKLQPTDVNQLLSDTLAFLTNDCLKRRVEVTTDLRANHAPIPADANQLRQVFLNLILNSLDAMEHGGRLHVTSRGHTGHLEIAIADNGCGIPADQLAHIFEPFYTTKDTGVGLGLAIVQGIIERHGGKIALTSRPGQGTTATITLPARAPTTVGAGGPATPPPATAPTNST